MWILIIAKIGQVLFTNNEFRYAVIIFVIINTTMVSVVSCGNVSIDKDGLGIPRI